MFLTSQPTVAHHAANAQGRDFIVGDLHGCRSMLDALLEHVGFDTARDRLFSVGDLVDRGPDSMACLDLLLEPWFYPVLGNHDAMLMAWILKEDQDPRADVYGGGFVLNGGLQWANSLWSWANEFLPLLQALPLVRVIGKGANDRFQVAHAELRMPDGRGFSNGNLDDDGTLTWDLDHFIPGFGDNGDWRDHVLWGRSLIHDVLRCAQRNSDLPEKRCEGCPPPMWGTPSCRLRSALARTRHCACKAMCFWMAGHSTRHRMRVTGWSSGVTGKIAAG